MNLFECQNKEQVKTEMRIRRANYVYDFEGDLIARNEELKKRISGN